MRIFLLLFVNALCAMTDIDETKSILHDDKNGIKKFTFFLNSGPAQFCAAHYKKRYVVFGTRPGSDFWVEGYTALKTFGKVKDVYTKQQYAQQFETDCDFDNSDKK